MVHAKRQEPESKSTSVESQQIAVGKSITLAEKHSIKRNLQCTCKWSTEQSGNSDMATREETRESIHHEDTRNLTRKRSYGGDKQDHQICQLSPVSLLTETINTGKYTMPAKNQTYKGR
jgi:hypothetical protein